MRGAFALAAVAITGLLTLATARSQDSLEVLRSEGFASHQRPAAVFRHDAHNEKAGIQACNDCHHVYEEGRKLPDESSEDRHCSDCHGLQDDGRQPGLMKAFHLNCKGCHQTRDKGPVMCGECHARRPPGR
jgi:hypothetical protein